MTFKNPKIIEVVWEDAWSESGWFMLGEEKESVEKSIIVRSIGYLLAKNKYRILMARSLSSDNTCADIFAIPKVCIKSIRPIKND